MQASSAEVLEHFQVGTLTVDRYGMDGTPIILIPGLASGAWVWQNSIGLLSKDHVVYVVTYSALNQKSTLRSDNLMSEADQSLLDLILTRNIDMPVLIGHSLGGTLAIEFAEEHSNLISGVVSVDGLPIFPGTELMRTEQRLEMAERLKAQMSKLSAQAFAAQQLSYMRSVGVLDQRQATELAKLSAESNPIATAEFMAEDFQLDLRPNLLHINVRLLVISPYNAADFVARTLSEKNKTRYYEVLLRGTPELEVISISPARHFVMFDQPDTFNQTLEKYLHELKGPILSAPSLKP